MSALEESFIKAMADLKPAATLVAGISGGSDSMALLELLGSSNFKIVVAHFNHELRGAESDADEQFVQAEAARRNLQFRAGRGDVRAHATGISIEMAARKLRHEFLAAVAREYCADIVLAHHADDQIELFLLRLLRGIEGAGLACMRESAPSPADPNVRILRPLLDILKSDLTTFLTKRNIAFREDSTNSEHKAERNRIRYALHPALRVTGPDFQSAILNHINFLRHHEHDARATADGWLERNFWNLPERLQRTIIVIQMERANLPVTATVIGELLERRGKPVTAKPGLTLTIDNHGTLRTRRERPEHTG